MFFEDEGKIYDKYSYNHIRLHKDQDRQMEKVIELLDDSILNFSRNINTISQTQELTNHIKNIFKDKYYPILIDEEGGKVSRLRKFIDNSTFSSDFFGKLMRKVSIICERYQTQ